MKRYLLSGCFLCILLLALCSSANADTKPEASAPKPPTKASILALADGYIAQVEPTLTIEDAKTISALKFDLMSVKDTPVFLKRLISDRISQFTVMLGAQKSLSSLTVASSYLVRNAPGNQRATNLLANVVALVPKRDDAVSLLEYTLQLEPDSTLAMINLANAYMNAKKDEKGRALLEKVVTLDPNNGRAYRMLACYWYKKGDTRKTVDYLMKAAALNGARLKKKNKNEETTQTNETKPGDTEETLQQKADTMKDLVPWSTADAIEDELPDIAQKIRDHVGKLMDNERMQLPKLPMMNTNDLKDYVRSKPIYTQWLKVISPHITRALKEMAMDNAMEMGASPGDTSLFRKEKAQAAAKKQMQEAMQSAEKMLQAMKNMPGMTPEKIAQLQRQLSNAARQKGIDVPPPSEDDKEPADPPDLSEFTDTGGMYAARNYGDYLRIKGAYVAFFMDALKNYNAKVSAITDAFRGLATAEMRYNDQQEKEIADEKERAIQSSSNTSDGVFDSSPYDLKLKKERLRHIRKMNELGSSSYRQWVNLYMPLYAQKFRPRLEEFWYVTTLYIRNMNNPKFMTREYKAIRQFYWNYVSQVTQAIGGGEMFPYSAEDEAEAARLQEEILAAEIEAEEQRKRAFEPQTKVAENSLPKWLEDKLVLSVACEFLAFKISPRAIEFEAYIPGVSGKVEYNFKENAITTSTALTAKLNIGVQIGPLEAKAEGEIKLLGSKTVFDLKNGKTLEESDGFAKGTIKGVFGKADSESNGWTTGGDPDTGGLKARVGATVQIDPALDNEVSGKVFMLGPGVNMETKL